MFFFSSDFGCIQRAPFTAAPHIFPQNTAFTTLTIAAYKKNFLFNIPILESFPLLATIFHSDSASAIGFCFFYEHMKKKKKIKETPK